MNCPSRTDDTMKHAGWNQSPRFFPPELTTRQDLNGIANAREIEVDGNGTSVLQGSSNWMGTPPIEEKDAGDDLTLGREASLTLSGINTWVNITYVTMAHRNYRTSRFPQRQIWACSRKTRLNRRCTPVIPEC